MDVVVVVVVVVVVQLEKTGTQRNIDEEQVEVALSAQAMGLPVVEAVGVAGVVGLL
jgi:hypothetical protein